MEQQYDLVAIGGGSGGLAVAQRAAQLGARVALLEPGRLGGTCVNLGCIPKKVMWYAAALAHAAGDARDYGFDLELRGFDWPRLCREREAYVARLNALYARNLEQSGVEHIAARARFEGPGRLRAGDDVIEAEHIVIATGGRPQIPALPGAGHGISSDGFFALRRRPERAAVVGGGYIAVELAGILRALGAQVQMIVRAGTLLRGFDAMLGEHLAEEMQRESVAVTLHAEIAAVRGGRNLAVSLADGRELTGFDTVLWATGRVPNTETLGCERAGIALGERGHVLVDELQRTNVRGIYAVGDVTDAPQLTPVAIAAGRRLAERLYRGPPDRRVDYDYVPTVIFSSPPVGTVGLSEADARVRYGAAVRIYQSRFTPLFHQLTTRKPQVRLKLVTAGAQERVVGCHLVGRGVDEILQGFAVAVQMGVTKAQLDDTVAIHPTVAEELVTLR